MPRDEPVKWVKEGEVLSGRELKYFGVEITGNVVEKVDLSRAMLAGAMIDGHFFTDRRRVGADLSGASNQSSGFPCGALIAAFLRSCRLSKIKFIDSKLGVDAADADLAPADTLESSCASKICWRAPRSSPWPNRTCQLLFSVKTSSNREEVTLSDIQWVNVLEKCHRWMGQVEHVRADR